METSTIMINFILMMLLTASSMAAHNVVDFGAKPDGKTDSAKPFVEAWAAACGGGTPATLYVPAGVFYVSEALFQGPCGSAAIKVLINGTIVASSVYSQTTRWLTFNSVDGLSIFGGTIDGQGQSFWDCKSAGRSCPSGAASLTIAQSKNVLISSLNSLNSKLFHVSIYGSTGVTVQGATISAPANSPNTDGIHVEMSSEVTITGATIETGPWLSLCDLCGRTGPQNPKRPILAPQNPPFFFFGTVQLMGKVKMGSHWLFYQRTLVLRTINFSAESQESHSLLLYQISPQQVS